VDCAIRISPDGRKVTTVYNDKFHQAMRPLLGAPDITRASHVQYDAEREIWVATRVSDGSFLCEHKNREECVKEEVRILNQDLNKLSKE